MRLISSILLIITITSVAGVRTDPLGLIQSSTSLFDAQDEDDTSCEDWDWRKNSLKLIKEMPVAGLFDDLKGNAKFEASGLTVFNGMYMMVFDNLHTIGVVEERLRYRDPVNKLVGVAGEESQFEAITVRTRTGTVLAVREMSLDGDNVPDVVELKMDGETFEQATVRSCKFDFELPGENKGFEGAFYYDAGKERGEFLLGLCEGNYCEGNDMRGQESGNGRVVVGKLHEDGDDCVWKTDRVINIPSAADFTDYSDMAIMGTRVAITTQEDSAVWIGEIDWETFEFVDDGTVLQFPRGIHCGQTYCNVEGIEWIDDYRVMVVTDRAKSKQPWQCSSKDQSVQVFALPDNRDLD